MFLRASLYVAAPLLTTMMLACSTAQTSSQSVSLDPAWVAASHVMLAFSTSAVSGCTLIQPITFTIGSDDDSHWPVPRGIALPTTEPFDQVLLYKAAQLGADRVVKNPDSPPQDVRRALAMVRNDYQRSRLNGVTWVLGEAYRCPK